MNLNSGVFSSAILCLNTFFPPFLQPLSFDYSQFEERDVQTNKRILLLMMVVIKISHMNNTATLLLCPVKDERNLGKQWNGYTPQSASDESPKTQVPWINTKQSPKEGHYQPPVYGLFKIFMYLF